MNGTKKSVMSITHPILETAAIIEDVYGRLDCVRLLDVIASRPDEYFFEGVHLSQKKRRKSHTTNKLWFHLGDKRT